MRRSSKLVWEVAAGSALVTMLISSLGLFRGLDLFFQDLLMTPKSVDARMVIVAIDDASLQDIGQWPWPREVFARALSRIDSYDPAVIGVDVMFAERSRLGGADDAALTQALRAATTPIVFPIEAPPLGTSEEGARAATIITPLEQFSDAPTVSLGHVNLFLDADGKARRFPRSIETPAGTFPSFSELVAKRGMPSDGLYAVPSPTVRIAYAAPAGSIRRIPFSRVLGGEDLSDSFADAVVLIGSTAADLHDEKPTPLGRGQEMPGVEIQANIANMFFEGHVLRDASALVSALWYAVVALLLALVFIVVRRMRYALIGAAVVFALVLITVALAFDRGYALSLVYTICAWLVTTGGTSALRYIQMRRDRSLLERVFGKYVSRAVLAEILRNPDAVALGGEERRVTVYFCDIRGFTTLSERTDPKELVALLNDYFDVMTQQVLSHGGVLDKYIGDAIMAFWGAPLDDERQADHAIEAGLAMLRALSGFNANLREKRLPPIDIGIGIATGTVIVGNVGSRDRFDYTVIGDTVNLASRLEGVNKEKGTHLIVSQATKDAAQGTYAWRELGEVTVKGREQAVRIYTTDA